MANIALRSPQYKSQYLTTSGEVDGEALSTKWTITIGGTLRYTIIKNGTPGTVTSIDISELCRDYLTVDYSNTFLIDTINIVTEAQNYAGLNATGLTSGSAVSFTDKGFEAYGTYLDESNPELPFIGRAEPTWLIAANVSESDVDSFNIYVPIGESGFVVGIDSSGNTLTQSYNGTDTQVVNASITLPITINRVDCTKYGQGRKVIFINKFGVQQELWFFLKEVKTLNKSNEKYQSNTLIYPNNTPVQYSVSDAPTKIFNTSAKQKYSLSSGYYPEFAVEYFEQLLLSEYVWIEIPKNETPTGTQIVPVLVDSSNMVIKTSVNDRLIDYTIVFEDAFDYINNIR